MVERGDPMEFERNDSGRFGIGKGPPPPTGLRRLVAVNRRTGERRVYNVPPGTPDQEAVKLLIDASLPELGPDSTDEYDAHLEGEFEGMPYRWPLERRK